MPSQLSEHFNKDFGSAIGDEMLLGESRRTIHQHHQLDDTHDLVQIARRLVKCAHQLDGDVPCRFLALGGSEICAEFSGPRLAFLPGNVP
jgi:hypothetical protein